MKTSSCVIIAAAWKNVVFSETDKLPPFQIPRGIVNKEFNYLPMYILRVFWYF